MIDYHDCGAQLQVQYRHDGGTLVRVYYHDDKPVTDCPMCGQPLPTELMRSDPDDPFDDDDADFDVLQPYDPPDEDTQPDD